MGFRAGGCGGEKGGGERLRGRGTEGEVWAGIGSDGEVWGHGCGRVLEGS